MGYHRLAGGLVFQQRRGLRPGELLSLLPEDIAFPEATSGDPLKGNIIVGLGLRTGTKLKRAQSVVVSVEHDPDVAAFLRDLVASTPRGLPLVPYSIDTYRRVLKKASAVLGLGGVGWTPHSARAGFASEARASGLTFTEIREIGRWTADSSLRTYLDLVSAASIGAQLQTAGLGSSLGWARLHWRRYVPIESLQATYSK